MLGKLIKYEFRATARYYLPIYGLILLLTLFAAIAGSSLNNIDVADGQGFWQVTLLVVYFLSILALLVLTLVVTINSFYKNLLGSEGYLMFTLPVTTGQQIFGKLLPALIWILISCLLVIVTGLTLVAEISPADLFSGIIPAISQVCQELGAGNCLLGAIEIIAIGLLSLATTLLHIYLALAIGQLANEHKFLASFGAYVGLQIIGQTLSLVVLFASGTQRFNWLSSLFSNMPNVTLAHTALAGVVAVELLICAVLFVPTWLLLDKKLNLA